MKFKTIIKWFFLSWGVVSLLGVLSVGGFFVYQLCFGNTSKSDKESSKDVRFVLNACELGDQRIDHIVHSYVSERTFTGDHLDAYSIKIKNITIDELPNHDAVTGRGWFRGDSLSPLILDAVDLVSSFTTSGEVNWFPTKEELISNNIYIYPYRLMLYGTKPTSVEIIFVRPLDKMVFYASVKM